MPENQNTQTNFTDDLFAPLNADEAAASRLAAIRLRLEAFNQAQEDYLEFLEATKKFIHNLDKNKQGVQDELDKIEARISLEE